MRVVFIILGGIFMLITSFTIIFDLLVPDACYYHTHDMNFLMRIFFYSGNVSNGHPEPNFFYYIIFFIIGGFMGNKLYEISIKKN